MTGACLSSNEERVVLYENRIESRDSAGLVMRVMTAGTKEKKINVDNNILQVSY